MSRSEWQVTTARAGLPRQTTWASAVSPALSCAIDQQEQPLRIVVAGDGQCRSPAIVLPKRSVPVARMTYVAAFGQFERSAGRAVGCRGQRMLLDQFLAGCLRPLAVFPEDLQDSVFPRLAVGGVGVVTRTSNVSPSTTPAGSFPGRSKSRAWRPSRRAARIASRRDGRLERQAAVRLQFGRGDREMDLAAGVGRRGGRRHIAQFIRSPSRRPKGGPGQHAAQACPR